MFVLRRLVIAQEEERRPDRPGHFHDHLGQQLTSLRLKLEAVRTVTPNLPDVHATLAQADALLTRIDGDIDFLSWELRPAALDDLGLKVVLEKLESVNGRGTRMYRRGFTSKGSAMSVSRRKLKTTYTHRPGGLERRGETCACAVGRRRAGAARSDPVTRNRRQRRRILTHQRSEHDDRSGRHAGARRRRGRLLQHGPNGRRWHDGYRPECRCINRPCSAGQAHATKASRPRSRCRPLATGHPRWDCSAAS